MFRSSLRLGASVVLLSAASLLASDTGLTPEEELKTFKVESPLRVELVAAEPQIESPCAMAFDDQGRIFVAENRGYPHTNEPAQGRIVMLESTHHDGHFDKSTVFAEGLTFPNGVLPWKGGLIVTCAPDVLFLKDNKGTGKADERRVLLTGFDDAKSTQLRVNCPTLRPDGWIYFAAGLVGGTITSPEHPEKPAVKMTGDLRWNPQTGAIETLDGRSQYGISFDPLGRRFICMNRLPVQHVVIESRWLRRNPRLAFSDTVQDCNERTVKTGLRGGGDGVRIWPISHNITTADSHAGSFSAACSVRIWPGGALPALYDGCAFSCDPTGNLVHVDRLVPHGATFVGESLLDKREVFASSDDWCRPVFLTRGPDGALYMCDMYRKIIEHPDYLPAEIRKHSNFDAGKTLGRIWRITSSSADGRQAASVPVAPDKSLEREDVDQVPLDLLLAGAESPDARIRFRAALGLGDSKDVRVLPALTHVVLAGADDKWTRAAVLSGIAGREREFATALFAQIKESPGVFDLMGDLGVIFGRAALAEKRDALASDSLPLNDSTPATLRIAFLAGVADGANAHISDKAPALVSAAVVDSAKVAQQHAASLESRTRAIGLLKHADWPAAGPALMAVATSKEPFDLRTAAVRAAASFNETEVTTALLAAKRWAAIAPTEREMTLAALLTQPAHVPRVLDAIESGALPKNALIAAQRTALSKSKDTALRDRAAKLLGAPADGDRMKAYEAEKVVLDLTPNPKHGGEIFKNICSTCHRLNQEGNQVGPDLLDIRSQPKESILMHIVVPDFEIAPGFAASNIELKDGSLKLGIIVSESDESVTVRQSGGVVENIPRSNITSLTASEHSLMPPGLEAAMSRQDMADLLSFLKGEN
ncbi:MAG: PVC-type heme-binding CxxCH protein [Chthoniobacter sp.]|uniref:PVC-type heme-binding CxxCH protein n=1 Tax=Chthoniobacter sp. TaxID=2510640 RepID=UPI0032A7ECCB